MPTGLTGDTLTLFLFAVLPGLVAIQVYNLCSPPQKKELTSLILEAVTYSVINMVIWWCFFTQYYKSKIDEIPIYVPLIVCILSPVGLAWLWYKARIGFLHHKCGFDHPTPKGWDYFIRGHHHFWVLFHLKNGKKIGGYFGEKSYSSTFPHDPELYVEQVWRVDDRGEFLEMVEGSLGTVIRVSDCEYIEFYEPHGEAKHEPDAQKGTDRKTNNIVGGTAGIRATDRTSSDPPPVGSETPSSQASSQPT